MREIELVTEEYYHIYNRGVDKRNVFVDENDLNRFFESMQEFNVVDPIGSIYESKCRNKELFGHSVSKERKESPSNKKLVNFVCYCLNPNHYHFILEPRVDDGVQKFMQRLGNGYTKYFNNKYDRSGSLFQGKYKAIHIDSNEYLLHLSAYVNLNSVVHKLFGHSVSKSSWDEYINDGAYDRKEYKICDKNVILGQFSNKSEYGHFAREALEMIIENKDMQKLLFE